MTLNKECLDDDAFLFTGERYNSSTGLYYLRARWMDPETGRFLSMDPWLGDAKEPATLNAYAYAASNPIDRIDPSGRNSFISGGLGMISFSTSLFRQGDATPFTVSRLAFDISRKGVDFIARWEGLEKNLYNDAAGHCTIGYGHLVHMGNCSGNEPANFQAGITQHEALAILRQDAQVAVKGVRNNVQAPLAQYEFDSLVSFTFNLGVGNLRRSTLLRRLNGGLFQRNLVPLEFQSWVYAGGTILQGLVSRRKSEAILFTYGRYGLIP